MKREDVYSVLDGERAYQQYKWPGHSHTPGEYLLYVEHHIQKARERGATEGGDLGLLNEMRKAAALCVACFEENGVPTRK